MLIGDVRDENRLYGAVREAVAAGEPRSARTARAMEYRYPDNSRPV